MCLRLAMAHKVSQAPHSITNTTSSRELIDQRAGCQGGSGPCREPASAVSTQLLAMLLCMLPCSHFHLQGKPESMLEESACGCKAWITVYEGSNEPTCLMYSGCIWVPHPNSKSWIGSLQSWPFCAIQPCYVLSRCQTVMSVVYWAWSVIMLSWCPLHEYWLWPQALTKLKALICTYCPSQIWPSLFVLHRHKINNMPCLTE